MNYKIILLSALLASPLQAETIYKELDMSGVRSLVGYSYTEERSVIDVMVLDGNKRVACVEFVDCFSDGTVDYAYYSHGGPNGSISKQSKELDEQFKELKDKIKK